MKRLICYLVLSLCVFVTASRAQEPKTSVIFDVHVIGLDPGNASNVETLMRDKAGLDRLIVEGKARLEASLNVRSRVNEQAQARIGQRVPIQSGQMTMPAPRPNEGSAGISVFPQIQYENTGLNLDVMPLRVTGDQIEVRFKLEISGVEHGTGTLTPSFVTRTLSDSIQMRAGEPTVLLSVAQPGQRAAGTAGPSQSSFAVLVTARLSN